VRGVPFVLNGVVRNWYLREWNEVLADPWRGRALLALRDAPAARHAAVMTATDQVTFEFDPFDPGFRDETRRGARPHYSFGHGIHYCLGNAVARLQTRGALQELVAALGEWDVDAAGVVRNHLVPGGGIAHTPITFEPSAA
jgi:hypothetical protein